MFHACLLVQLIFDTYAKAIPCRKDGLSESSAEVSVFVFTNTNSGHLELFQWLRPLPALPRGPEFSSQRPHGSLQPSIWRSGALFRHGGVHEGRVVTYL